MKTSTNDWVERDGVNVSIRWARLDVCAVMDVNDGSGGGGDVWKRAIRNRYEHFGGHSFESMDD